MSIPEEMKRPSGKLVYSLARSEQSLRYDPLTSPSKGFVAVSDSAVVLVKAASRAKGLIGLCF